LSFLTGTDTIQEKPTRVFQLLKTRHQVSRSGSHVLHVSKNGIHFSPQLPSQIDRREIISKPIPSENQYINFFNDCEKKDSTPFLPIWKRSQLLIHGYGSSGKAELALSILMYPITIKYQNKRTINLKSRKVLVISLLYPDDYYKKIASLIKAKDQKYKNANIECVCFYSGYLSSENLVNKILIKLESAVLNGEPFTGILLDGLHNATLQFPKLQGSDVVWPTLYSLLAKYNLTSITTYTNFTIVNETGKEEEILLKDDRLLLDFLLQGSDYYLNTSMIKPSKYPDWRDNIEWVGNYKITLQSAIRHKFTIAVNVYCWDKNKLKLEDFNNYYEITRRENEETLLIPNLFLSGI
jgi:hypothetical protein